MRLSLSRFFRIIVAVGLTAYVLYRSHPADVAGAAAGADLRWIAAAIGLVLVDRTLMALRWIDLLSAVTPGSRPRFPIVLRIFFVSSFVSNFVPSVAADMYRAYALSRYDVHLAESTASVLIDRLLGVLSMVIVGLAALPFAREIASDRGLVLGLGIAFLCCAAASLVVFSERAARTVVRLAAVLPSMRLQRVMASLTDAVRRYAHHHKAMTRVLVMSVLVQAIRVVQAWCLGQALGIDLSLTMYFALVPAIVLIMQLPITVNGLGTTQWAFAALFVPRGAAAAPVFALSILFLALGVIGSLPGGLLYASGEPGPAKTRTTS
jgi:glycosyltransferase 2 family protein